MFARSADNLTFDLFEPLLVHLRDIVEFLFETFDTAVQGICDLKRFVLKLM